MNRIQKVSKALRLILQYGLPLLVLFFLALAMGPAHGGRSPFPAATSRPTNAILSSDSSTWLLVHEGVQLLLFLFWYRKVIELLRFFEKGILFTAETVRCLQVLGGIYLVGFAVSLCFYFLPHDAGRRLALLFSDPFVGLFIIFIGWLIDEARKIREEQELTV